MNTNPWEIGGGVVAFVDSEHGQLGRVPGIVVVRDESEMIIPLADVRVGECVVINGQKYQLQRSRHYVRLSEVGHCGTYYSAERWWMLTGNQHGYRLSGRDQPFAPSSGEKPVFPVYLQTQVQIPQFVEI